MDSTSQQDIQVHMKTFLDIFVLSHAKKIYLLITGKMYKSGFAKRAAKLNNIPVEIIQCKMMEVPSYADRANLLITTTVADKSKYNFPVINARALLTGIGLD